MSTNVIVMPAAETLSRRDELEFVVKRGLATFVEVGRALAEIRDAKLYARTHGTFESYCRERLGLARQTGYQLIAAANVVTNVRNCGHGVVPMNEAQARPLVRLAPDEQVKAWKRVVANAAGRPITAEDVKVVVARKVRREKALARSAAPAQALPAWAPRLTPFADGYITNADYEAHRPCPDRGSPHEKLIVNMIKAVNAHVGVVDAKSLNRYDVDHAIENVIGIFARAWSRRQEKRGA